MKKKADASVLNTASTIVLVGCALSVTFAVVRREFALAPIEAATPLHRDIPVTDELLNTGVWMGSRQAPVVIVEFGDFQCPACALAALSIRELRTRYGDKVSVLYRHFPLVTIHPQAYMAAIASECAGAQGAFETFHDALFAEQSNLPQINWISFAATADVSSISMFETCLDASWPAERVAEDMRMARQIGITGTPSIIINGRLFSGLPELEILDAQVREALDLLSGP